MFGLVRAHFKKALAPHRTRPPLEIDATAEQSDGDVDIASLNVT